MADDERNERIKWRVGGAGFVMQGSWVYLADEDTDPFDCLQTWDLQDEVDHNPNCKERWNTVWALPGETREEAEAAHTAKTYLGSAYHVADCELLDDRPVEAEVLVGQ